jgi:tetratricopeptide (TPR) repeat protein
MSRPQPSYEEAVALQEAGKLDEARRLYTELLRLDPAHARAHNNLGAILHREGDLAGAIARYESALHASPDLFDAARNLGIAWYERGDLPQAERFVRRALELEPGSASARQLLGSILAHAEVNSGALLSFDGDSRAAVAHFERAIALEPDLARAHFNLALERLALGDYERAWPEYEWRWKLPEFSGRRPDWPGPQWDRSPPGGKTLLLYAEQGLGNAIQYVRYAPLLARQGAKILVRCPPPLVELLRHAPGVSATVSDEERVPPAFDAAFPLLSLPLVFRTTRDSIPLDIPYLRAPDDEVRAWRGRIGKAKGPRVGLVWGSFTRNEQLSRRKSIALRQFSALAGARRDLSFFSLQKGPHAEEASHPPAGLALVDLAPDLDDFSDTAAAIANLDLVITVDTAVAHLAGAMAKPVWTLVSLPLDWRWAGEGGSVWYPTMRVFRQARHGDWDGVLSEVARALEDWVRGPPA